MTGETVLKIKKEVETQLEDSGVPYAKNYIFSFNSKLTRSMGGAKRKGQSYYVELSPLLKKDPEKLKNTLIHELLHTVSGCMNHGKLWKNYAEIMNFNYGYNITRCYSVESLNTELREAILSNKNYVVECERCRNKTNYQKYSKVVQKPERYRCKCGGKLKSYSI